MSEGQKNQPASMEQIDKPQEDLTGRDRLVSNVTYSWAVHFVLIIVGFIMP